MNNILVDKEEVIVNKISKKLDINTTLRTNIFGITRIVIDVLKSCTLELNYNLDNSKIDILFNVKPNVEFKLYEYKTGDKAKIQYTFNIEENSNINIEKFNSALNIKEMIITNLNGENSAITYTLKSIATTKEVYDMVVSHNCKNTNSYVRNNAVCISDGKVYFQVSGYVDKGIKNCVINQNNHIINLTDNKCEIRPNLYIDEFDTEANHSALIGGFDENEMFYMQSRGINEITAKKLLMKGFLTNSLTNKKLIKIINNKIREYWR